MFNKIRYVLKNWKNIENILIDNENKLFAIKQEREKDYLNLCLKHKQRSAGSHFSSHNCHYCIEQKRVKVLETQLEKYRDTINTIGRH